MSDALLKDFLDDERFSKEGTVSRRVGWVKVVRLPYLVRGWMVVIHCKRMFSLRFYTGFIPVYSLIKPLRACLYGGEVTPALRWGNPSLYVIGSHFNLITFT